VLTGSKGGWLQQLISERPYHASEPYDPYANESRSSEKNADADGSSKSSGIGGAAPHTSLILARVQLVMA
jgi:hypothetical protein